MPIHLARGEVERLLKWCSDYEPAEPSALGGRSPEDLQAERQTVIYLQAALTPKGRGRRRSEASVLYLPRPAAELIAIKWEVNLLPTSRRVPWDLRHVFKAVHDAIRRKRGPARIEGAALRNRVSRRAIVNGKVDERRLMREYRRRARHEAAVDQWVREGNTFLTSDKPFPRY